MPKYIRSGGCEKLFEDEVIRIGGLYISQADLKNDFCLIILFLQLN